MAANDCTYTPKLSGLLALLRFQSNDGLRVSADPHPGNIAVDAEGGGRLIYYDFGMMGSIPGDVRSGLLELFYGVYQKDPDRCIDALMQMGVLVPGGDRVAIRRTAVFFLKSFEVRHLRDEATGACCMFVLGVLPLCFLDDVVLLPLNS